MEVLCLLPSVLGWLKMIEVFPPRINHSDLSPYQRPAKDTKVMAFLINLCDRSKLPAFFCSFFFFFLWSARGRKLLCFTSAS